MKPLNILLLNPPNENELIGNDPILIKEQQGIYPPLGLMYIASYLKENTPYNVTLFDCQAWDFEYEYLEWWLKTNTLQMPDIIGLTAMTFTLLDVKKTIGLIKKLSPDTKIIVGGPHPTIYPQETLSLGADAVVVGEGERGILEAIVNEGIALGSRIEDLDSLPFPYRNYIDKYYCVLSPNKLTTMMTSRGCPFNCNYCDRPAMGKRFRARSPINVVDEMDECVSMGIKEFFIYDDTFTVNKERVYEICREIARRDLKIIWDIRSRVNTIDYDLLRAMKYAGLERIHLGVESGVQRILDNLEKGITLKQCENAFKWCRELKIKTLAYFMIGNPGERKKDIDETYSFCRKLCPTYAQFTILTPFPATKLYSLWLDRHDKDIWKDYAQRPSENFKPPIWNEYFTREELQKILKKIYKSYYLNPKFIWNRVKELRNFNQFKRYVKAGRSLLCG